MNKTFIKVFHFCFSMKKDGGYLGLYFCQSLSLSRGLFFNLRTKECSNFLVTSYSPNFAKVNDKCPDWDSNPGYTIQSGEFLTGLN